MDARKTLISYAMLGARFTDRDHPNYGDDLPKVCPSCCRAEHCFIIDADGVTCPCGEMIEGGE